MFNEQELQQLHDARINVMNRVIRKCNEQQVFTWCELGSLSDILKDLCESEKDLAKVHRVGQKMEEYGAL